MRVVDHLRRGSVRVLAVVALLLAAAAAGSATAAFAGSKVHLRGTVYTFDDQQPIAGASVRIDELPGLEARSAGDGSYDLEIPDGTRITPYVEAAGHHGIHLQTFVTAGSDLDRVNFQIPTTGTYSALAALLDVPLDPAGDPAECAVVSTFSTLAVREAGFDQFVAYGAHGVAGATASATPALPSPVYFNDSVIPDRSRTESSIDGGVIWTGVPAGTYRFHADHPGTRFADFIADCEPGRLVNANPPWGFFELRPGERNDTRVEARLSKPAIARSADHRVLRLKLKAAEYIAAGAELRQGGATVATERAPRGPGAFTRGRHRLALKLKPGVGAGRAKLVVTVDDANGNRRVISKRLRLTQP